jgi:nucleotide-binding universal stress UspA family protein
MTTLRVLVPLDGSGLSEAIRPLLRDLGPVTATLLRVLEGQAVDPEARAAAERELERIARSVRAEGAASVRWVTREGKPAAEILAAARDLDAGLIAMTTHGRGGFDRLVFGSVAESVIRGAHVPVLAVRASEAVVAAPPAGRLFERVRRSRSSAPQARAASRSSASSSRTSRRRPSWPRRHRSTSRRSTPA